MELVNVRADFHHRLANRDKQQGDGSYTAEEFRNKYLSELDSDNAWKSDAEYVTLDFSGITEEEEVKETPGADDVSGEDGGDA